MKLNEFIKECQENGVFKHLSIYIVTSWVLLQVMSVVSEPLSIPKAAITYILLILLLVFPLYIFFLWKYRIKPSNIEELSVIRSENDLRRASSKSAVDIDPGDNSVVTFKQFNKKFKQAYFIGSGVIGVIALAVAVLIIKTNIINTENSAALPSFLNAKASNKIAILNFDNNTADEKYDVVGKMAVDWIMHGITQNKVAQVISPKIIEDYTHVLKASIIPSGDNTIFTDYLKPSKVIIGNFYLKDSQLLFQSSITDENMNKTLIAFKPIACDPSAPLDCIEALKQRILGYLITEEKPLERLQESPPNFEAYQSLLNAKARYGNSEEHLRFINSAIEADSTYFEAKVYRLAYFYNTGEFTVSDSLLQLLKKEPSNNKRQLNLLKMYESLLQGNNRNTYKYLKQEYEIYPFDIETNSSTMTVALQFVNEPEDIALMFPEISMDGMDLMDCTHCEFRYYIKALSDLETGNPGKAIELLEPFAKTKDNKMLKEVLVRAYIKSGKPNEIITDLISNFQRTSGQRQWQELSLYTGKEFLFKEENELANAYFDPLIKSLDKEDVANEDNLRLLAFAHFYKENYQKAEGYLESLLKLNPRRKIAYYSALAISYQKNNKPKKAEAVLKKLHEERNAYDYGHIDYALAQYYATISDDVRAIEYLFRAVTAGKWYTPDAYHNDRFFKPYLGSKEFNEILNYWK